MTKEIELEDPFASLSTQMVDLVQMIETTPSWIILTISLSLILIDLFITSDGFLMLIGLALMAVGCMNYFGVSGNIQIASFPILLIFNLVFVRKFFLGLSFNKKESIGAHNLIGKFGKVTWVNKEDGSNGKITISGHGEWNFCSRDNKSINLNDKVKVIDRDGLTLIIDAE
jgi:membrane protein implicated in regulation of membrane protease activity